MDSEHSSIPPREGTLSDPQHLEQCTTTRPGSRSRAPDSGTCALRPDSGRMASLPTLRLRSVAMRSIAARSWRTRWKASFGHTRTSMERCCSCEPSIWLSLSTHRRHRGCSGSRKSCSLLCLGASVEKCNGSVPRRRISPGPPWWRCSSPNRTALCGPAIHSCDRSALTGPLGEWPRSLPAASTERSPESVQVSRLCCHPCATMG